MQKLISIFIMLFASLLFSKDAKAQQFDYLYNTLNEFVPTDAVETDNSYWISCSSGRYPNTTAVMIQLSKTGTFISDTAGNNFSNLGSFNLLRKDSSVLLINSSNPNTLNKVIQIDEYTTDLQTLINTYTFTDSSVYAFYNGRLFNDSILILTGVRITTTTSREFDGVAYVINLKSRNDTILEMGITNPFYDFVTDVMKMGAKYYFLTTDFNTYDTCNSFINIKRYRADFSLDTIVPLCSSTNLFPNDDNLHFVSGGLKLNESTFSISSRIENRKSQLERNTEDIAHLVLDTKL